MPASVERGGQEARASHAHSEAGVHERKKAARRRRQAPEAKNTKEENER
jgi:hypothetical protein